MLKKMPLALLLSGLLLAGCGLVTPTPATIEVGLEESTPEMAVRQFYGWYLNEIRQKNAPLAERAYQDNNLLSFGLRRRLDTFLAACEGEERTCDPFLCIAAVPDQFEIHPATLEIESGVAWVPVTSQDLRIEVIVELERSGDAWMISDFFCSLPDRAMTPGRAPIR